VNFKKRHLFEGAITRLEDVSSRIEMTVYEKKTNETKCTEILVLLKLI
jgi:hypothetical protein